LSLPRRQERGLLGILLLEAGRVVPIDRLCSLLWEDNPPDSARRLLRSHASRIRALLTQAGGDEARVTVVSDRDGYRLTVAPELVDIHQFRRLVDAADRATDLSERNHLLRDALSLWHGPPLHNAASDRLRQRLCADLEELHLYAMEEFAAVGLELGRHRELIPDLARLTGEHPLRERLVEQHMLALHRAGRTAEALDLYTRTRIRMADQLGLDPSPALQHAHKAILGGNTEPPTPQAPGAAAYAVPAQLPADVAGFAGRTAYLDRLDALLAHEDGTTTAVVISAIAGTAGIGKTALAVHWAYRVAHRFPDGQIYVNLRGFEPAATPMGPAEAVRGFLDAFGVPPERVPDGVEAQIGLARSLLAGKRVLFLLDNARDADQIRPLLPGSPGCLVVVTSRNQLTSLVAAEGAHPINLDVLSHDEARELLIRRLGPDRVAAEPDVVEQLISLCARLPLALSIVAARAAIHPDFALGAFAAQLRDGSGVLTALDGGDVITDIRAACSWSYRTLTADAARMFRLLGLHPGPDFGVRAAACLADVPPARVRAALAELTRASLLTEHVPDRFTFHDLLRAYAAELTHNVDSDTTRRDALRRMVDHYLHTAYAADRLLDPYREPIRLAPPETTITPMEFADPAEALQWSRDEHRVLMAVVEQAASMGFEVHSWQLAWCLETYLQRQGLWDQQAECHLTARSAAGRIGDEQGQAHASRALANAYARTGRVDEARQHYLKAFELFGSTGDRIQQGRLHLNLGLLLEHQGRYREARDRAERAYALFEEVGHEHGQASALNTIGYLSGLLGDHRRTLVYCGRSLSLHRARGDRAGAAAAWDSIGHAHHQMGHYRRAISCFKRAVELLRGLADRYNIGRTLAHLGDAYHADGNRPAAVEAWEEALNIFEDLGHSDATQVENRLAAGLRDG
jgi:DNA-binding SARP family transcriptional activator/tetratricopeptide (TPR) repeat protein